MKKLMLFAGTLALFSCNQPAVDKKKEGEKVMQTSRDWSKAAATKDVEKTVAYWADDAVFMAEGMPMLKGKPAIRKMVEQSFQMPGYSISWQPQSVEVADSGEMAYLIENDEMSFTDSTGKQITVTSKGVTIWRKQADGSWKNVVDISTPEPIK